MNSRILANLLRNMPKPTSGTTIPLRGFTTYSVVPVSDKAAGGYVSAFNKPTFPRGPYPGFNASLTTPQLQSSENSSPHTTLTQEYYRIAVPLGYSIKMEDPEGVKPDMAEQHANQHQETSATVKGPAILDVSVSKDSQFSLSSLPPGLFVKQYDTIPEELPGMQVDQQEKKPEFLERILSKNSLKMGAGAYGSEIGDFAKELAKFVIEQHRLAREAGKTDNTNPDERTQTFDNVKTFRTLSIDKENNDMAQYIMHFGTVPPGAKKYYDNAMHIHPGKRIEEHLTGSGTSGVIFSWEKIKDADGIRDLENIEMDDPCNPGKTLYIYVLQPNSSEALILPQGTPHKFKACLSPEVYKFCNEALPTLLQQKLVKKGSLEPTHDVVNLIQEKPELMDLPELQNIIQQHGGKDIIQQRIEGAGFYVVNTLHPEERQEIAAEGVKDGVRSAETGSSITAQTVPYEPSYRISEATMQEILSIPPEKKITPEEKKAFQNAVLSDYNKSEKQEGRSL
jgi:hypothetical protein